MSMFWLVLLCCLAGLFVIIPLLRSRSGGSKDSADVDRAALLRQMHSQRKDEVAATADAELQQVLQDELDSVLLVEHADADADGGADGESDAEGDSPAGSAPTSESARLWWLLPVVPLLAGFVYFLVTDPGLGDIRGAEAVMGLSSEEHAAEITRWREKLEHRVANAPEDSKSWYLLGHAFLKEANYTSAAEAFGTTHSLVSEDITVQIYWLQSRYLAARGQLDSVSQQLAQDILQTQPNSPVVLEILALHAFSQDDKATAIELLNRAVSGSTDPVRQASFGQAIAQIRAGMTDAPAGVQVNVQVPEDQVRNLPHSGALFVIARPIGGGMPYAVVRRPALLMPVSVRLDDLVSMSPERKLSAAEAFEVVVRMSYSGSAMPEARDWQWQSAPLSLIADDTVTLDVVLTPSFSSTPAPTPAPAS